MIKNYNGNICEIFQQKLIIGQKNPLDVLGIGLHSEKGSPVYSDLQ